MTFTVLGGRKQHHQQSNMIGHGLYPSATEDFHFSVCVYVCAFERDQDRMKERSLAALWKTQVHCSGAQFLLQVKPVGDQLS